MAALHKGRLMAIIRKEFIQIRRDPPSLAMALIMPVLMLFFFGYAVTTDVKNMPMAVLDMDHNQASIQLAQDFVTTGYFYLTGYAGDYSQLEALLDSGKIKAALVIPYGYEQDLKRGQKAPVQFLVDGSDPLIARTAFSTAEILGQVKSQAMIQKAAARAGLSLPAGPSIDMEVRVRYNPGLESLLFNVPGLIGLIMQNVTVMLTAFALVRERERGTLEQLMVTPIRGGELMAGKLIPYVLISFVDTAIVLGTGTFWFHVPIRGNVFLLLGLTLLFLFFALGVGIFFSTIARNQLQAMQMTMLFILPSVLLSGFVFPRSSMPLFIQYLGNIIPLTYFLVILRGIMLKGAGMPALWPDVVALAAFGAGIIILASLRFRKRVE